MALLSTWLLLEQVLIPLICLTVSFTTSLYVVLSLQPGIFPSITGFAPAHVSAIALFSVDYTQGCIVGRRKSW